jgi:hypothetical protein
VKEVARGERRAGFEFNTDSCFDLNTELGIDFFPPPPPPPPPLLGPPLLGPQQQRSWPSRQQALHLHCRRIIVSTLR